jgi:hypothetical protein
MPDLLTHLLAAHAVRRLPEIKLGRLFDLRLVTFFLLGAILPDLLNRPFTIVTGQLWVSWLTMPTHTPVGCLLLCYIIAMLVPFQAERKSLFIAMFLGCGLHFGLDILQRHIGGGGYFWLFPFSWQRFHVPLFWSSNAIYGIPFLLVLVVLLEWFVQRRKRQLTVGAQQTYGKNTNQ